MDPKQYLAIAMDPRTGIQLLAMLVAVNVLLGTILALRAKTFNKNFLLNFLQSRILEQLLPVALLGFAAIAVDMPFLLVIYGIGAAYMLRDVGGDLMAKVAQLWGSSITPIPAIPPAERQTAAAQQPSPPPPL